MKQVSSIHKKPKAKHRLVENFSKSVNTVSSRGKRSFERYASYIDKYGNFHPNPLSLHQLVNFGKLFNTVVTSAFLIIMYTGFIEIPEHTETPEHTNNQ